LNSEVAVREVEGARPFYENALGISFSQRCLHTTARRVSKRTLQSAKICGVSVHDRSWLSTELARADIPLIENQDEARKRGHSRCVAPPFPRNSGFCLTVGMGGNRRNVAMKHLAIN
jgi:hypothetical protein